MVWQQRSRGAVDRPNRRTRFRGPRARGPWDTRPGRSCHAMKAVWPNYFADPFVLRVGDTYFAYGTDAPDRPTLRSTGREFPVLPSDDLCNRQLVGGVLDLAPGM